MVNTLRSSACSVMLMTGRSISRDWVGRGMVVVETSRKGAMLDMVVPRQALWQGSLLAGGDLLKELDRPVCHSPGRPRITWDTRSVTQSPSGRCKEVTHPTTTTAAS